LCLQRKQSARGHLLWTLVVRYDLRVSDEFKIFTNVNSAIIDPKAFDERSFVSVQAAASSFAQLVRSARSIEYFRIPRDC